MGADDDLTGEPNPRPDALERAALARREAHRQAPPEGVIARMVRWFGK